VDKKGRAMNGIPYKNPWWRHMKKIGLAAACGALVASTPAFSQSSVTLYGIIDTGVEYVSHANAKGDSVVRMPGITGSLPSRWGLRGKEDLGGGYSAVFTLENGFNVRGGDIGQGGRLFGRQAWVGIRSPYGTVSFGRQYTMAYYALLDTDIVGPAIYGIGSLDAWLPNARADNSIQYTNKIGGLSIGATYALGRDSAGTGNSPGQGTCASTVGALTQCREWSAMLKYDAGSAGAAIAYDEQRGGVGAASNFFDGAAPAPLTQSGDKDARLLLSGYVKIASTRFVGGWVNRKVETVADTVPDIRSNLFYIGASYYVLPELVLESEAYRIVNAVQDARATLGTARATYQLSKRTAVYVQLAYLANSTKAAYSVSSGGGGTTPAKGVGQTGAMVGMRHFF
jgi:predicted porin